MKKVLALITLLLFGTVYLAVAGSGRESKQLPPQEVEIMYSSEDHAIQVKDINDVIRWRVLPDGTMVIKNAAGNTLWGINAVYGSGVTGEAVAIMGASHRTIPWNTSGGTAWVLTTAQLQAYKSFLVEPIGASPYTHECPLGIAASGATVNLSGLLTAAVHGMKWTFTNAGGTTAFVLYDSNGRFNATAGTTENYTPGANRQPEDQGDTVTIQAVFYPANVSGWYVHDIKNFD